MNYDSILARANELYRASKGEASNYMHVEIRSDQVKCMLRAIVEAQPILPVPVLAEADKRFDGTKLSAEVRESDKTGTVVGPDSRGGQETSSLTKDQLRKLARKQQRESLAEGAHEETES